MDCAVVFAQRSILILLILMIVFPVYRRLEVLTIRHFLFFSAFGWLHVEAASQPINLSHDATKFVVSSRRNANDLAAFICDRRAFRYICF